MRYALASLTRWLPMPASVATFLYDTYPQLRRQLLRNAAIPGEAWAHLDPKAVPVDDLVTALERSGSSLLCARVCESTDRRAGVVGEIVNGWVLPVGLQRQVVAHRGPTSAADAVLASTFEDEFKLQVASIADKAALADWLITNPSISDDEYLNLMATTVLYGLDGAMALAQRPHLESRVEASIEAGDAGLALATAAAHTLTGENLERFAFWLVDQQFDASRQDLLHALSLLLGRFDVPRRIARMLAKHQLQRYPQWVPAWADVATVDDPRRSATPLGELDVASAVELTGHLSDLAMARVGNQSIVWQLTVLILREDLPDETVARALRFIPSRMFESALFDHWYDVHQDTDLCDPTSPVASASRRGLYDLRRRARLRQRIEHARALARNVAVPERVRARNDDVAKEPDDVIAAPKVMIRDLESAKLSLGFGVSATAVSQLLIEHFGDGTDEQSRVAWQTAFRLIETAPDERTLEEIVRAVDAITTT